MVSALILSLAACSGNKKENSASSIVIDSSSKSAAEPTTAGNDGTKAVSKTELPKTEGVDVDLTKMSSTMVYSEVLNMQQHLLAGSVGEDIVGDTVADGDTQLSRLIDEFSIEEGEWDTTSDF